MNGDGSVTARDLIDSIAQEEAPMGRLSVKVQFDGISSTELTSDTTKALRIAVAQCAGANLGLANVAIHDVQDVKDKLKKGQGDAEGTFPPGTSEREKWRRVRPRSTAVEMMVLVPVTSLVDAQRGLMFALGDQARRALSKAETSTAEAVSLAGVKKGLAIVDAERARDEALEEGSNYERVKTQEFAARVSEATQAALDKTSLSKARSIEQIGARRAAAMGAAELIGQANDDKHLGIWNTETRTTSCTIERTERSTLDRGGATRMKTKSNLWSLPAP